MILSCMGLTTFITTIKFVCVVVLRPSKPNGLMSSAVNLPKHIFTGQALNDGLDRFAQELNKNKHAIRSSIDSDREANA